MKRSEMLSAIEKNFPMFHFTDVYDLLEFIEAQGMLPPAYAKFQNAPVLTMYLKNKVNEWKPEDEAQ